MGNDLQSHLREPLPRTRTATHDLRAVILIPFFQLPRPGGGNRPAARRGRRGAARGRRRRGDEAALVPTKRVDAARRPTSGEHSDVHIASWAPQTRRRAYIPTGRTADGTARSRRYRIAQKAVVQTLHRK